MAWSPQQDAALKAVSAWLKAGDRPVFRLFGYAGTGKTTLAKQIAEDAPGEVAFRAFTGKAALVLKSKGCRGASTIEHSSMMMRSASLAAAFLLRTKEGVSSSSSPCVR